MNIIADLHTHTISSGHAYSTLGENIAAGKENGLLILGMTDHAPALEGAPKEAYFRNMKVVRREWDNLTVLRGVELNILNEHGDVDLSDEVLNELDYAVASLHAPILPKYGISYCTSAAIGAMSNPHVFILGHPDDDFTPLDYEAVTIAAKHYHVALEVNNSSLAPNSFRKGAVGNYYKMLRLANNLDVQVVVSLFCHMANFDCVFSANMLCCLWKVRCLNMSGKIL